MLVAGARAAIFPGRSGFLILSELPHRTPDERPSNRRLARWAQGPLSRANPVFSHKLIHRTRFHHDLDAIVWAASDRLDHAAQLHRDSGAPSVNGFIAHIDVSRQPGVRQKRVATRAFAKLRRVLCSLARRSRVRARRHELRAQRCTLALQLGELLPQLFKLREFIVGKQRNMLLNPSVRMLKLCFERVDAVRVLFQSSIVNANGGNDVQIVHGPGKNEILKAQVVEIPTI